MKSVKVYVRERGYKQGKGGSFIEVYEWDKDYPKEWFLKFKDNIIAQVKRDNPTAEFIDIELSLDKTTTSRRWRRISIRLWRSVHRL